MESRLDLPFAGLVTFLRAPACSDLSTLDADIAVLGVPSDEGTGWLPGARLGPRRLREMSMRFAGGADQPHPGFWEIDEDRRYLDYELAEGRIVDCGDVDVIYTRLDTTWANTTAAVRTVLDRGALPVILGGDHGITAPVIHAYSEPLTVVHFDAHVDYQPFVHGVRHSHGNPMRVVNALPHVDKIIQVGVRSFRTHQDDVTDSRADGNHVLTVRNVRTNGANAVLDLLDPGRPVYISIDIDVLDLPLVPGTSAPEPSGLTYDELRDLLVAVAQNNEVIGLDLVEVNPMIDHTNQATSFLGVQLIVELLARAVEHPGYRRRHPRIADEPEPLIGAPPGHQEMSPGRSPSSNGRGDAGKP